MYIYIYIHTYIPFLLKPVVCRWTLRLFPWLGCCEYLAPLLLKTCSPTYPKVITILLSYNGCLINMLIIEY